MTYPRRTLCIDCKHYRPDRNPKTGRVLPRSQPGHCAYPITWPEKMPKAYYEMSWGVREKSVRLPERHRVWWDDTSPCQTFEQTGGAGVGGCVINDKELKNLS